MSDKAKRPPPAEGGRPNPPPGKAPGKKTRTQALPATGARVDRLRTSEREYILGSIEIGDSATKEASVKNTSKEFVEVHDFWTSLGQTEPAPTEPEFEVAGSTLALAPSEVATLPITFSPRATTPEDLQTPRRRVASISLLDEDGAIAGTVRVRAIANPPSKERLEAEQASGAAARARRGTVSPPRSYDELLADLRAAKELFNGSDLDGARQLLHAILTSWHATANEAKVGQRFRGYGFSRQHAVTLAGHAHDEINKLLMFPTPVGYDLAITKTEVAEEVLRVMYGETKEARGLKALNDAGLPALAGDAAEEIAETAQRIVTDASFAAGFGVGTIEGIYGALRDLIGGAADGVKLAMELAEAYLTGGMIRVTIKAVEKLNDAAGDMAAAIRLLGPEVAKRWHEGSSYEQGNFRGEVVGYVVAQIALLVATSGESAALQASGKWGAIVRALRTLDAVGDITQWGQLMQRSPSAARIVRRIRNEGTRLPDTPSDGPSVPPGDGAAGVERDKSSIKKDDTTVDGCFVAGTMVLTPGGLQAIEDIAIGMRVLATDVCGNAHQVSAVLRTFVHTVPVVLDIALGNATITCSPAHPFWIPGKGWMPAGELRVGERVSSRHSVELSIESIASRVGSFVVYNISVDALQTYHVSERGVLVHNKPARLDLEADFRVRRDSIYESITEIRTRIEKLRVHANTKEKADALEKLGYEVKELERQTNAARHVPPFAGDDPAVRYDPLVHVEQAETRALQNIERLERELTPKRPIPESRPPRDEETVLADGSRDFTRTGRTYQGRQIYRDADGRYYYVDNLHRGAASEIEVFSDTGAHLGTMSPEGIFNPAGKVAGRYLPKGLL